jgi:hypothetical protein
MPSWWQALWCGEAGDALVEFALVLSVLMLILMGIFDFGRAFYANAALTNAARDGARFATVNYSQPNWVISTTNVVKGSLFGLNPSSSTLFITPTISSDQTRITVQVDYKFYAVTGVISRFFGTPGYLRIHAQSSMLTGQ